MLYCPFRTSMLDNKFHQRIRRRVHVREWDYATLKKFWHRETTCIGMEALCPNSTKIEVISGTYHYTLNIKKNYQHISICAELCFLYVQRFPGCQTWMFSSVLKTKLSIWVIIEDSQKLSINGLLHLAPWAVPKLLVWRVTWMMRSNNAQCWNSCFSCLQSATSFSQRQ